MIGKEDNNEEVSFKVADRRKFNSDGSLRDGVTLDPPKPVVETPAPPAEQETSADPALGQYEDAYLDDEPALDDDGEIPGAKDPASFVNFLSTLATNAAAALGDAASGNRPTKPGSRFGQILARRIVYAQRQD